MNDMRKINDKNIDHIYDFDNIDHARHFLNNLYIGTTRELRRFNYQTDPPLEWKIYPKIKSFKELKS